MHFLPDVYVPCEQCHGKRYNRETLDVRFKGKTIADVLDMPVEEALEFFQHIPKIRRRLETLNAVGLGYIRLGQPATTLSGGEAQRVKLATELSKVATGRTLYILDEPTTGLHFADVQRLLEVLHRLVDQGNSVVVIEHNLDVIKTADRIIDMGPEGGEEGGEVVAAGTPEEVAGTPGSYTGEFLAEAGVVAAAPKARRGRKRKVAAAAAVTRRRRAGLAASAAVVGVHAAGPCRVRAASGWPDRRRRRRSAARRRARPEADVAQRRVHRAGIASMIALSTISMIVIEIVSDASASGATAARPEAAAAGSSGCSRRRTRGPAEHDRRDGREAERGSDHHAETSPIRSR